MSFSVRASSWRKDVGRCVRPRQPYGLHQSCLSQLVCASKALSQSEFDLPSNAGKVELLFRVMLTKGREYGLGMDHCHPEQRSSVDPPRLREDVRMVGDDGGWSLRVTEVFALGLNRQHCRTPATVHRVPFCEKDLHIRLEDEASFQTLPFLDPSLLQILFQRGYHKHKEKDKKGQHNEKEASRVAHISDRPTS